MHTDMVNRRALGSLRRAWHAPCLVLLLLAPRNGVAVVVSNNGRRATGTGFVSVVDGNFNVDGSPYRYMGVNMWQAAHLASVDPERLKAELDTLQAAGLTNLRIMAASEGPFDAPLQVVPTLQPSPGQFDHHVAASLDLVMAELSKRNMKAVMCMGNMWVWSGGFAQFLAWARGQDWTSIPFPPAPINDYWTSVYHPTGAHGLAYDPAASNPGPSWDRYQVWVSEFYGNAQAVALYHATLKFVANRTNSITGVPYRDDPSIMAWELANEPRSVGVPSAAYRAWIASSAELLKQLCPNHLVTIGSEGITPYHGYVGTDFAGDHADPNVDYATVHVWPQNWGWYDPIDDDVSAAVAPSIEYLESHIALTRQLGKPLVLEEFGLARDGGSHDYHAGVAARNEFYEKFAGAALQIPEVQGVSPWAFSGQQRPPPGAAATGWSAGSPLLGDPPHEVQGWYGIYDQDKSTLDLLATFAHAAARGGIGLARSSASYSYKPPAPCRRRCPGFCAVAGPEHC